VLVITYVRPVYPILVAGVMTDNNADLAPDMLHLTLSDTLKSDQRIDSVRIDYRGAPFVVRGAGITVKGTAVEVRLPDNLSTDSRPSGAASLFLTVGGAVKSSVRQFTDGVSPAIIAADVLENSGTSPDILFITFSEPVAPGTIRERQLLYIRPGTADTVALTITQLTAQINDSTFSMQVSPAKPGIKVQVGDRLRLVPASSGGTLADLRGNMPHDLNRSVVIGFKRGAASIEAAWYLDTDADGIVDRICLRFKRRVEQSEIDTINVQRSLSRGFKIPFSRAAGIDDSTFSIPVGDSIARIDPRPNTGGAINVMVEYRDFPGTSRTSAAADSAAPVIDAATIIPGAFNETGTRENDILIVTMSEGVPKFDASPFLLSARKDGQRYRFSLQYIGTNGTTTDSYRFTVLSIDPPHTFAVAGDSIWIDSSAGIADSGGVVQTNPNNRRALLTVDWPKPDWNISISDNPFSANTPITGAAFGSGVGTAIVLRPTAPVDETRLRAVITIYDPVGSVVNQSEFTPFNNGFRVTWRGENRKGRRIGYGTYLAIVRVDDGTNPTFKKTLKIGYTR
jgi:hypothetical protein